MTLKSNDLTSEAPPAYSTPTITTYEEGEILEEVGPAVAYTGSIPFGF